MSDLSKEVATIRALCYLDLIAPRAVVTWAQSQLIHHEGVRGIVNLAELSELRRVEVDACVTALAEEIGLGPVTEELAGIAVAAQAARKLVTGAVTPIEAARRIWSVALLAPSAEPRLRAFIGLASEWEDDPENRGAYEEDIRSEARQLAEWSG